MILNHFSVSLGRIWGDITFHELHTFTNFCDLWLMGMVDYHDKICLPIPNAILSIIIHRECWHTPLLAVLILSGGN